MFSESHDDEQIIERVAALDIGKAEVVCCVRLPAAGPGQRRVQEVTTHSTMTRSLTELANRLVQLGVERVVMEATSDYWRPPFYLFEGPRSGSVAGQRQRRSTSTGPAEDRCLGRGLVVQGRRTADASAQLRAAPRDPPTL